MAGTFVIAQGGGPTAVINQTVAGATLEIMKRHKGARVLGALFGVRGIRDGDYVELSALPEERLRLMAATPGAALGSTRDKPDAAYCEKILAGLKREGADAFINIGGNDTSGTQAILRDAASGGMIFVHAPKTIDNDLVENDHTPGFISAASFVTGAFLSVELDFRALPGIYVGIVMGRHAGFLTAASAAWRLDEESGPHLVYVPERPFERTRFVEEVRDCLDRRRRCIVAMSEGVTGREGKSLVETLVSPELIERDQHGNVRLAGTDLAQAVERMLAEDLSGVRSRVDTFGYLPRGSVATIDATDAAEAFEAGRFAVEAIERGGGSVTLQYDGQKTVCGLVPLEAVAGKTRHMPEEFLDQTASDVSPAGLDYLGRLLPKRPGVAVPFV